MDPPPKLEEFVDAICATTGFAQPRFLCAAQSAGSRVLSSGGNRAVIWNAAL